MTDMRVNQILNQMRVMAAESRGVSPAVSSVSSNSFANALGSALSSVNDLQQQSSEMSKAFELGDPNVSLAEVMISSQKSNLAFEATVQIRNKFLQAYQDIMNMPV
jgi:flagellar hook-basal body complex protein FliE